MNKILVTLTTLLTLSACGGYKTVDNVSDNFQIQIDNISRRVSYLEILFSSVQTELINSTNRLSQLDSVNADIQRAIFEQQSQLNSIQATIAELTLRTSTVRIIDLCGDGPGYDEVIIRMSDGSLVAYFESGNNHFLSLLQPGNYRTTDGSNCSFTIDNNKQVCYSNGICE